LLLLPIPVAVMFEAFRHNRGKLVIKDRIKEREALFACFVSLDIDRKMFLTKSDLLKLF